MLLWLCEFSGCPHTKRKKGLRALIPNQEENMLQAAAGQRGTSRVIHSIFFHDYNLLLALVLSVSLITWLALASNNGQKSRHWTLRKSWLPTRKVASNSLRTVVWVNAGKRNSRLVKLDLFEGLYKLVRP